ncbi:MAG: hypothetical protein R6U30_09665 [Halomonas sp.]|uniref:hypothetical protein n=1 Tax=Halomonas sp. TaxID=1486246 RepID=UPI00397071EE
MSLAAPHAGANAQVAGSEPLRVRLAEPGDDAAIRRLLRQRALGGEIRLTFEREPDYFASLDQESLRHDTLLVEGAEHDELIGMGSRLVQPAWQRGDVGPLGYLSQIRLKEGHRLPLRAVRRAWQQLGATRLGEEASFDLTSITLDNRLARRLLEHGLPGQPRYHAIGDYRVHALATGRALPEPQGIELSEADETAWQEILAWRLARRRRASLSLAGPAAGRVLRLIARRRGRLLAGLAVLDATPWRQLVVRGYAGRLAGLRPALNLTRALTGTPRLPRVGEPLHCGQVVDLAHAPGEEPAAIALLRAAARRTAGLGLDLLLVGHAERDPLGAWLRHTLPGRHYLTRLYAVAWSPIATPALEALREGDLDLELSAL